LAGALLQKMVSDAASECYWISGVRVAGYQSAGTIGAKHDSIESQPAVFIASPGSNWGEAAGTQV
jgi:hypothetical protein